MDAIVAVAALGGLFFAFKSIGWWRWFWIGEAILLGGFELVAKISTGKTLSQQFWAYHAAHPIGGWIAVGIVLTLGIGLAIHLAWKQIRRK